MNEEEQTRRFVEAASLYRTTAQKRAGLRVRINEHLKDMRLSDLEAVLRMIEQWKRGIERQGND